MLLIESAAVHSKALPPLGMEEMPQHSDVKNNSINPSVTFSIWPPSQSTREAVVTRLIETLSTPSVLSKRYGIVAADEAALVARTIEEEAFAAIDVSADNDDDGLEILQIYAKEVSKRMLDTVNVKSYTASPAPGAASTDGTNLNSAASSGLVCTAYE